MQKVDHHLIGARAVPIHMPAPIYIRAHIDNRGVHLHIPIYRDVYIYIYIYIYVAWHVHVDVCIYVYMYVYT